MRIEKCYFCSGPTYPGHGMMFVRNDCKTFRFCRPKCHKHFKAKHNPRKLAWTKACRKLRNKELTKDKIIQFQRKVNEPEIYNRDVYVNTIKAMTKIADIRKRREQRFWRNRMKLANVKKIQSMNTELKKHVNLISNPDVVEKVMENENERVKVKEEERNMGRGKMIIEMQ